MNPTKLICHTVIFLLASVLFSAGAIAYVLHGSHLLELMTKEMGQAESLRIYQKLIVHESEPDGEQFELSETLMFVFPEAFRSEITSQTAERIHVVSGRSTVTIIDGKVVADYETEFDRYKDIFLYLLSSHNTWVSPSLFTCCFIWILNLFKGKVLFFHIVKI